MSGAVILLQVIVVLHSLLLQHAFTSVRRGGKVTLGRWKVAWKSQTTINCHVDGNRLTERSFQTRGRYREGMPDQLCSFRASVNFFLKWYEKVIYIFWKPDLIAKNVALQNTEFSKTNLNLQWNNSEEMRIFLVWYRLVHVNWRASDFVQICFQKVESEANWTVVIKEKTELQNAKGTLKVVKSFVKLSLNDKLGWSRDFVLETWLPALDAESRDEHCFEFELGNLLEFKTFDKLLCFRWLLFFREQSLMTSSSPSSHASLVFSWKSENESRDPIFPKRSFFPKSPLK